MAYKIVIADVTELGEEIIDVSFSSRIPCGISAPF